MKLGACFMKILKLVQGKLRRTSCSCYISRLLSSDQKKQEYLSKLSSCNLRMEI